MKDINLLANKKSNCIFGAVKTMAVVTIMLIATAGAWAQEVVWKKNFGGSGSDSYYSVTAVPDGVVAVGCSRDWSFGNGDWTGVEGKGNYDAIIVKYDNSGNVVWKKNFGGSDFDYFYSVTTVSDGIIAVGDSYAFGNGDWVGVTGKGRGDAIIVKFDHNGNVLWKKNFGGNGNDLYRSVTTVSDGIIAVGTDDDAIIVKYDHNGNVLWKKSFGTNYADRYYSVTTVSDGVVAVGHKYRIYEGNTYIDVIILKYDNSGNVLWNKTLDNNEGYMYYSITTVSDGVVAVGHGDSYNSIIVKYDNAGNVVWRKDFNGIGSFESIIAVSDGVIATGTGYVENTGDWAGFIGHGARDAIMVKYDFNGKVVWKKHFGGKGYDEYHSVAAVSEGFIAVGESYALLGSGSSFGTGDLTDVSGKGDGDAIIVKYTINSTGINDVLEISDFKIYPNPAKNSLFIESKDIPQSTVKLYDMLGKEVLSRSVNGRTEINISHLAKGVYCIKVISDGQIVGNRKIVKQ